MTKARGIAMVGRFGGAVMRRGVVWLATATLLALLCAGSSGCGGTASHRSSTHGADRRAAAVQVQQIASDRWSYARARFHEMCAGCHTLANAGATGPRFDLDADPGLNDELVRFTILHGASGMPSFASSISYREFEELTRYILAVARRQSGDTRVSWQAELRREGEASRPQGWPPRRYLTTQRENP